MDTNTANINRAENTAGAQMAVAKKKIKWATIWDHFTTGLLILLMCSPILILGYIFLWFVTKNG